MKKILIIAIAFIFICLSVTAQEKSRKEIRGDKYAFRYAYDDAIEAYTDAEMLTMDGQRSLCQAFHAATDKEKNYGQWNWEAEFDA